MQVFPILRADYSRLRYLLLLPMLLVSDLAWSAPNSLPQQIEIEFSGLASASMHFRRNNDRYLIKADFYLPGNHLHYQSTGYLRNNQLTTLQFTEVRNGKVTSNASFSLPTQTVIYGKANETKRLKLLGQSYDFLSLPWQISLNPQIKLSSFQITNGKEVYLIKSNDIPVKKLRTTRTINTSQGTSLVNIYEIKSLPNSPVLFGYSSRYQNLPVYIQLRNKFLKLELKATSIVVDSKKIL